MLRNNIFGNTLQKNIIDHTNIHNKNSIDQSATRTMRQKILQNPKSYQKNIIPNHQSTYYTSIVSAFKTNHDAIYNTKPACSSDERSICEKLVLRIRRPKGEDSTKRMRAPPRRGRTPRSRGEGGSALSSGRSASVNYRWALPVRFRRKSMCSLNM